MRWCMHTCHAHGICTPRTWTPLPVSLALHGNRCPFTLRTRYNAARTRGTSSLLPGTYPTAHLQVFLISPRTARVCPSTRAHGTALAVDSCPFIQPHLWCLTLCSGRSEETINKWLASSDGACKPGTGTAYCCPVTSHTHGIPGAAAGLLAAHGDTSSLARYTNPALVPTHTAYLYPSTPHTARQPAHGTALTVDSRPSGQQSRVVHVQTFWRAAVRRNDQQPVARYCCAGACVPVTACADPPTAYCCQSAPWHNAHTAYCTRNRCRWTTSGFSGTSQTSTR